MTALNDENHWGFLISRPGTHGDRTGAGERATFRTPLDLRATIVSVAGEIDAFNADQVSSHLGAVITTADTVVVDLSGVEFLGVSGWEALVRFDEECASVGVVWVLITSRAVNLMLSVAGSDRHLPALRATEAALTQLAASSRPSRSLPPLTIPAATRS